MTLLASPPVSVSRLNSAKQGLDHTDVLYVGFMLGQGGDALVMLDLAAGMAARGHRVRAIVPAAESSVRFPAMCRARGVGAERSSLLRVSMQGVRQSPWDMLRFFAQHRPRGILHLHTGDACLPRQALMAMRLLRYPRVFVTVHSPYDTLRPGEPRTKFWANAVARQCHTVCCPSDRSSRLQIGYGLDPRQVETIPNGVDIERFRGGNPHIAWQRLGVASNTPLVVFTSRLDPQKRPEDALIAFARISEQVTDALLVFVGGGALERSLQAKAIDSGLGERVRFVGYQDNIPDWLAAATVWVLPTESENFSLAVLEALAAGCPMLTTLCPGNDEILVNGDNAMTVPVGDSAALAQRMGQLLVDRALRQRLSEGATRSIGRYSVKRMVDRYAAIYQRAQPTFS